MSASSGVPPGHGEFFAPLPLAFVGLMIVNDRWLKPAFHSWVTGKLSDVAICFFLPLFVSELLGLLFALSPNRRLCAGALLAAGAFAGLEVVDPLARGAIHVLEAIAPHLGIHGHFRMTSDWTDLLCLACVPCAVHYGRRRLLVVSPEAASRQ